MQLLYRGKTKDVYEKEAEVLRLAFSDRVTKNDAGEIDPGGNSLSESTVPGQAEACLRMSAGIFTELERQNIAATHMISYDPVALTMNVQKARLFSPGLEWIARWFCTGSFMRRYAMVPGIRDGLRLRGPVFEITLKDDAAGDPLIAPSAVTALGIVDSNVMDDLWANNQAVMLAIKDMFTARKLDLWDIKIEWGLDTKGRPMLIDEISPGSCRAYKAGTRDRVQGLELAKLFEK